MASLREAREKQRAQALRELQARVEARGHHVVSKVTPAPRGTGETSAEGGGKRARKEHGVAGACTCKSKCATVACPCRSATPPRVCTAACRNCAPAGSPCCTSARAARPQAPAPPRVPAWPRPAPPPSPSRLSRVGSTPPELSELRMHALLSLPVQQQLALSCQIFPIRLREGRVAQARRGEQLPHRYSDVRAPAKGCLIGHDSSQAATHHTRAPPP